MSKLSSGVALLVDIENIRISIALETAIVNIFPSAEIVKVAVGNWQLLNLDRELQARGYHLFHVPTGHNNADREILNLSWLLKDYQEIVIVSNDKIFIQLAHQFNSHNKSAYIVYRSKLKSEFIITKSQVLWVDESKLLPTSKSTIVLDSQSQQATEKLTKVGGVESDEKLIKFTSQSQLIQTLKKLVIQNRTINTPESLAIEFYKQFGVKASTAIASCQIPVNFNKFITDSKILLTLKAQEELKTNIKKLIKDYPSIAQDSGKIGHKFKQIHGISITEKMKQVGAIGKSSQFISQIQLDSNSDYN